MHNLNLTRIQILTTSKSRHNTPPVKESNSTTKVQSSTQHASDIYRRTHVLCLSLCVCPFVSASLCVCLPLCLPLTLVAPVNSTLPSVQIVRFPVAVTFPNTRSFASTSVMLAPITLTAPTKLFVALSIVTLFPTAAIVVVPAIVSGPLSFVLGRIWREWSQHPVIAIGGHERIDVSNID